MKSFVKAVKWIAVAVAAAVSMGWLADEQAALENAWGKPVRQNQGWRW